jgi:hypothetical protein
LADGGVCTRGFAIPRAGKSPMICQRTKRRDGFAARALRDSGMTRGNRTAAHGSQWEKFQAGKNLLFETGPNTSRNSDQRRRRNKQWRRC